MQIIKNLLLALLLLPALAHSGAVETLHDQYRQQGSSEFSAERGREQWRQPNPDAESGGQRSCSDCHGMDLAQEGKHATTGKRIEPMAPSVNAKRLSDAKKIEKWFKRNCKWTLGRACTPQEKGDFLLFLQQQ
jgi:hypothetical protein